MHLRSLGGTGLRISEIGFGGWQIGGDSNTSGNLGQVDDRESVAAIHRALELGVNWIDTAPGYGCGHSEQVIGRAIKGMREKPLVFTKCGFVWGTDHAMINNIDPTSIRMEVEASLKRLGVGVIDLYQIHWVEPENDPKIEEAWAALVVLKDEGKVAHIGVSNFDVEQLERIRRRAPAETLQPPYSLLERGFERDLAPYCLQQNIGVLVYSPLQTGLLTGAFSNERVAALPADDARLTDPNFLEPRLTDNLERVARLRNLADEWGTSTSSAAIAWVLAQPAISGAIVGFRTVAQVDQLLGQETPRLEHQQLARIEAIGWRDA